MIKLINDIYLLLILDDNPETDGANVLLIQVNPIILTRNIDVYVKSTKLPTYINFEGTIMYSMVRTNLNPRSALAIIN